MRALLSVAVVTAAASVGSAAHASLTPSEADLVRSDLAAATDVGRVRSLVARPDLSADEAAGVMARALTRTAIDPVHASFLRDLVFGDASAASRPALAVATVRGLVARADVLISGHAIDLDRSPAALAELDRVYAFIEDVAAAAGQADVTQAARSDCERALADHFSRNASVLQPDAAVAPPVARVRARAAIALLDLLPDGATKRLDAANALSLTGARRALLIELRVLALDAGVSDSRVASLRALLDRLPGARAGLAAVILCGQGPRLVSRLGSVIEADPAGSPAGARALWEGDPQGAPTDGWTSAAALGLAALATLRAVEQRPELRAQVERDGGLDGVEAAAAMLAIDAPRAVDAAAAHLLAGRRERASWLADAIGALDVFARTPNGADGATLDVGGSNGASGGGIASARLTHVTLGPTGAASTFHLDGHLWRVERDRTGLVTALRGR
jgi:hypothetical protein